MNCFKFIFVYFLYIQLYVISFFNVIREIERMGQKVRNERNGYVYYSVNVIKLMCGTLDSRWTPFVFLVHLSRVSPPLLLFRI